MPPDDYEAIEAAVLDTARGRWFLAEFARRNRSADTTLLLAAIERLETLLGTGQQLAIAPPKPHLPIDDATPVTSAASELFAMEMPRHNAVPPLTSVPDDVAWIGEDAEAESSPAPDLVEIDDQAPIWPAPEPVKAASPAPAQSTMLAAALAQAEKAEQVPAEQPETAQGGVSPPAADPAELDALSFEEKSVYFA
jgi:hypothetical protein